MYDFIMKENPNQNCKLVEVKIQGTTFDCGLKSFYKYMEKYQFYHIQRLILIPYINFYRAVHAILLH